MLTLYKSTFYELTFYKLTFYEMTFYKLTFWHVDFSQVDFLRFDFSQVDFLSPLTYLLLTFFHVDLLPLDFLPLWLFDKRLFVLLYFFTVDFLTFWLSASWLYRFLTFYFWHNVRWLNIRLPFAFWLFVWNPSSRPPSLRLQSPASASRPISCGVQGYRPAPGACVLSKRGGTDGQWKWVFYHRPAALGVLAVNGWGRSVVRTNRVIEVKWRGTGRSPKPVGL